MTPVQARSKGSLTHKRRSDNLEWIKTLRPENLKDGLENKKDELAIPMAETSRHEELFIQYPGKESKKSEQRQWTNPRDFRPKYLGSGASSYGKDLTFSQLWDPLADNLRSLEFQHDKDQFAAVLGILFYRMAFMIDYVETQPRKYKATVITEGKPVGARDVFFGSFWNYRPLKETVRIMGKAFPDWADMSFEAYLHYNSLLAWNEDGKCFAKFPKWTLSKPNGRINTLLTHVRFIGFLAGKVELSVLLGDFTRQRGMSPATPDEIRSICGQYLLDSGSSQQRL